MTALSTSRLTLNELGLEDACDLFEARGDPQVMAFWDWPADPNPDVTRAVVADMLHEVSAGHAKYWTLRLRADGTFVGLCDLSELRDGDSADIGFMLAHRHWGQGLAQEAVTAVVGHARAIGLKAVGARVHDENERSVRLLEQLGFVEIDMISDVEIRPGVFRRCRRLGKMLS